MGIDIDKFASMSEAEMPILPPAKDSGAQQPEQVKKFQPVVSDLSEDSDVLPIDDNEIFSFAEQKFIEISKPKQDPVSGEKITAEISETMSPEMIEISSAMYVQILEGVWGGVCEWFSGVSGNYDFDKKMKERYEKITAMYFAQQNVKLTPSHFFAIMTLFVLFGSGYKAFKDRKKRLKAENFAKKSRAQNDKRSAGEQATLFDVAPVTKSRNYYAAEPDAETGILYYTKDPISGAYAKKADREQVPPELSQFLLDFKQRNSVWPTKRQVEAFLKS